jgi:hypothetical protein
MVKSLPESDDSLVLRTDFSDDAAWEEVRAAISAPVGDFQAYVEFVNDPQYEDLTVEELTTLIGDESSLTEIYVVDTVTIFDPEHPVLVVDVCDEPGRTFRVIPIEMWCVENNLSIANMDWEDFADSLDEKGIFRGFGI